LKNEFQTRFAFSGRISFLHCQKRKTKTLVGSNAALKAAPSTHNIRHGYTLCSVSNTDGPIIFYNKNEVFTAIYTLSLLTKRIKTRNEIGEMRKS
jgi:hypothetical protein